MSSDDAGEGTAEPSHDEEGTWAEPTPSSGVGERLLEASARPGHLDAYLDPDALVIKDLYTWDFLQTPPP